MSDNLSNSITDLFSNDSVCISRHKLMQMEQTIDSLKEKNTELTTECQKVIQMEQTINSLEEKNAELTSELEQYRCKGTEKLARFVLIPNKITDVDKNETSTCCENKCIDNNLKSGSCIFKNGYVRIRDDGKIQYFLAKENGKNNWICIHAGIGFDNEAARIFLCNGTGTWSDYQKFSWTDGDIFGCGVVFQPNKESYTIVFFTKNGQKIGNPVFLEEIGILRPCIGVKACSAETNFGYDLATKPFIYDEIPGEIKSKINFFFKKMSENIVNSTTNLSTTETFSCCCSIKCCCQKNIQLQNSLTEQLNLNKKLVEENTQLNQTNDLNKILELKIIQIVEEKLGEKLEEKIAQLSLKLEHKADKKKPACFVKLPNKIIIHDDMTCCENKCINKNIKSGSCINKNGYVNVLDDGTIKYYLAEIDETKGEFSKIESMEEKNNWIILCAENEFNRKNCYSGSNSLFYYEVKMIKETDSNYSAAVIGFNGKDTMIILNNGFYSYQYQKFSWKNGDIFVHYTATCCNNKCININLKSGSCISNKGFINVRDNGKITYYLNKEKENNKWIFLYSKNFFKREDCYSKRNSLFYYEVKMIKETDDECRGGIGLSNCAFNCKHLQNFNWEDGDIFGCGVVFQSNKELYTIVFFTKNGNKIGKEIFLEDVDQLRPMIGLRGISMETNFGTDLSLKPFIYDLFVLIPNEIINVDDIDTCCNKKCINNDLKNGSCVNKNGYINIWTNEKIHYVLAKENGKNDLISVSKFSTIY
ncbi:hypothetical protein Mgra_00000577 [Meloidogyne graminicola]|uniref:B30.2/SPRY domain-containing protein n=1 Tax=Meloidogyne graminicola TaxID=189291 RepID=A0A8T0A3K3_9BILA|nr:hypothetical protein Mgra_00000577 [Meloidogyne graminicola]